MSDVTIETARPSVWRKMRGNTGALIGGTLLAGIILIALLAPLLADILNAVLDPRLRGGS